MPQSAAKTTTARRRQPAKAPQFQEPLIDHPESATKRRPAPNKATPAKARKSSPPPELEPGRPTEHNGIAVVKEELRRNLPSGPPFKISILHLEDGTRAFACRDCEFTGDTNVQVQHHRNDVHGTRYGKKTPKVVWPKDDQLDDLILPPRGEMPAPTNPLEMQLGEFLALVPSYAATADLVDRLERERDAALAKIAEMNQTHKDAQHALAVYPTLQAEVVDLRLLTRNTGSYEELKTEVMALRAWKKKVIQRLEPLGFQLTEEDSKEQ